MTLAYMTNAEIGVSSNFVDATTDRQRRILAARPGLYLTPEPQYFKATADSKISRWYDATGQGYYGPGGSSAPAVVSEASGALRSIQFTGSLNQILDDNLDLDRLPAVGAACAVVALVRFETGVASPGGIMGAKLSTAEKPLILFMDNASKKPSLQSQFGTSGQNSGVSSLAIADSTWHVVVASFDAVALKGGQISIDGVSVGTTATALTTLSGTGHRKIRLGAYANPASNPMVGKLAGMAVFPLHKKPTTQTLFDDIVAEFQAWCTAQNV